VADEKKQPPVPIPVKESDSRDINAGREIRQERPVNWPPPPPPEKSGE
jgi:hypothetical protein